MEKRLLESNYWRDHALKDLIPYWYEHVRDKEFGGYHPNLTRDWKPRPPWERLPPMVSRHVFGFCAAYMFSGEQKFLDAAREGVEYLIGHAWDKEYGGWYETLTRTGEPKDTSKYIASQLYTNVGLTQYYITTGDERPLSYVMKSVEIQKTRGHDEQYDGYYQSLNKDLSPLNTGKNKHSHYGYVSSLVLNLWLATRDPEVLRWSRRLTDLSIGKMMDQDEGWIHGYINLFDRQWNLELSKVEGREVIPVGAQLTAALSFLRLHHQTGDPVYREKGIALAAKTTRHGWDAERWCWYDMVGRTPPYAPVASGTISWWVQIYGCFLQLQLYRLTGDKACLDKFEKSETYFDRYFKDREYGGVFQGVSRDGVMDGDGGKAAPWRASYHEMEHALLVSLYLDLYVNSRPATLHYRFDGTGKNKKRFVSIVDDPKVKISSVKIDGKSWKKFNAEERSIELPSGKNLRTEVTFVR